MTGESRNASLVFHIAILISNVQSKYRIMLGDPTQAVKDSGVCPFLYHCSFHMINCKNLKAKAKNNFKIPAI